MMLQIKEQKEKSQQHEKIIDELKAEIKELKKDGPKLNAGKNTLQHKHNEEKKDDEQRFRNISVQLANNDQRLENISTQLTQLNTHTNTEIDALHSTIDSVNQAQAVFDSGLKQTKDSVSDMKSQLEGATCTLIKGQSKIAQDIQKMFEKQQAYL
ncbi:unnamed protein product [Mytilus coruscus]|uniref:Uncharacterized protein n=1 Tax=Mytilus coruscus TaxID=42192 RepID=A0A6J8E3R7_MYTCO|nr:unnamed protein product [Mytilus coruscus]